MNAGTPPPATLEVCNLTTTFGAEPERVTAVNDVSFQVMPGEVPGWSGNPGPAKA